MSTSLRAHRSLSFNPFQASIARPLIGALVLTICAALQAQFTPLALTPDSFNYDLVVERTAPTPIVPVTTATMEAEIGRAHV